MSSRNGKNFMTLDNFTSEDFCKIIESCGNSGVLELRSGDFFIRFKGTDNSFDIDTPEQASQDQPDEKEATLSQLKQQADDVEEQLDQLHISDPFAFEELLAGGELEDAEDENQ